MPSLDVSEVFDDPDFIDSITVTRRVQTKNTYGEVIVTPTTIDATGVICTASPEDLKRMPDEQTFNRAISIVTQFRLRGASTSGGVDYQPDTVTWNGNVYIVRWIDDYSRYGGGFIQAIASSIETIDAPSQ